ncbi:hypothetical protein [Catellatospora paridis]|uniref:hypothetical protein n=1 Tax=Catellatospora paridis TaxID=1617086 RepID=UPI0012D49881|nr:hypothetical protein [Catellatospora paridis]
MGTASGFCFLCYVCLHLFVPDGFVRSHLFLPLIAAMLGLGSVQRHLSDREPIEPSPRPGSTPLRRYGMWAVPVLYTLGIVLIDRLVPLAEGGVWRETLALVLAVIALGAVALAAYRAMAATRPRPAKPLEPAAPVAERAKIVREPLAKPHVVRVVSWRATPVNQDGGGVLTWDDGTRCRKVRTSAQLQAELLRLHLSTVTLPRFAEFTPDEGVTVRISLGVERSVLVTEPGDLRRQQVVTMDGLSTFWVAFADTRVHVYPPEAYLPMELAMEVLRRYCATGELPGVTMEPAVGERAE